MNEPFVTKGELAKHLGVSSSTIRVWTSKKLIPEHTYLKVENTYRYKLNAVSEALVEQRLQESEEKPTKQDDVEQDVEEVGVRIEWEEEPVELSQAQIALAKRLGIAPENDLDFNDLDEDI